MMRTTVFLFLSLLGSLSWSQEKMQWPIWPVATAKAPIKPMTTADLDFVAGLLHGGHLDKDMLCTIKVRTVRETRRFSTGEKWVEMLEVEYSNKRDYDGIPSKAFFAVGADLKKRMTESNIAGTVEEITLEAKDELNHILTFQHDGKNHIVHLEMLDMLGQYPCLLKY